MDDGAGAQQEGVVLATVVDSSDEQRLAALGNVSTGYAKHRWLLRSNDLKLLNSLPERSSTPLTWERSAFSTTTN